MAFIANNPAITNSLGINIYTAMQHLFYNQDSEPVLYVNTDKKLKLYNNLKFEDDTEQTTAAVQSDWNETDDTSLAYIQNKPAITSFYGTTTYTATQHFFNNSAGDPLLFGNTEKKNI